MYFLRQLFIKNRVSQWVFLLFICPVISPTNADSNPSPETSHFSRSDVTYDANKLTCEDIDCLEKEICNVSSYYKQCRYQLNHAHFDDLQNYLRDRNLIVLGSRSQDRLFLLQDGKTIEFWLDDQTQRKILIDAIVKFDQDRPVDHVTIVVKIFAVRNSSESGVNFNPLRAVMNFVDSLDASYTVSTQELTLNTKLSGIDVDKILKAGNSTDVISEVLTIPLPQVAHGSSIATSNQSSYFIDTGAVNAEQLNDGVLIKGRVYLPGGKDDAVEIEDFSFEFGVPVFEVQNYKDITVQKLQRNSIKQMRLQKGTYISFFRSDLMHIATEKSKGALSFKNIRKNERSTIYGLIGVFDNGDSLSASKVERNGVNLPEEEKRGLIHISDKVLDSEPVELREVCNSLNVQLVENRFGTLSFQIGFDSELARRDIIDLVVKTRMELKNIGLFRSWKHEDFMLMKKIFTQEVFISDLPMDVFKDKGAIPFEIAIEEPNESFKRVRKSKDKQAERFTCKREGFLYPRLVDRKIDLFPSKK